MNTIIDSLQKASVPIQALGVTVGGLVGVFATLGFFYLLIVLANKTQEKSHRQ
jgi:hypothetical protein